MIVAEKQRAMRLSNKRLQQSIALLIKALEKELASLDTDIDATVRGSPAWREKEDLLISVRASLNVRRDSARRCSRAWRETLLRIRSLAGYIIGTLESRFRKRQLDIQFVRVG